MFAAAAGDSAGEPLAEAAAPGRSRRLFKLGPESARERVWLQCDSAHVPALAGHMTRTILLALAGAEPSRYRQLALARAHFAVLTPIAAPLAAAAGRQDRLGTPLFDAGMLGALESSLAAMDRFAPTLVVHLQDWGAPDGDTGFGGFSTPAGGANGTGSAGSHSEGVASGLRLVESFYLDSELHQRLARAPRRRWGRPTAEARALAAHPEARLGGQVRRYAARQGATLFDAKDDALHEADGSAVAALRLAPGRYTAREEWRRLGGMSLCEVALARYGATGICAQALGGGRDERAAALLAAAEGAVLFHLGLETLEAAR